MANPYDYITIAEGDILHDPRSPHNFLPTSLKQQGRKLLWTAPGYATYGSTPTNNDIMYSSCATHAYKLEEKIILPPNMQKICEKNTITDHQKHYIAQYKNAAATIDHYFKTNSPNNRNFENAISNWKETCDELVENPYFTDGWDLPAFFPFYTNACEAAYKNFFNKKKQAQPDKSSLWNSRLQHADQMHDAWIQMFSHVTSPNNTPFPKCLWYHKYYYVYKKQQPELWESFYHDTSFSEWGKIE